MIISHPISGAILAEHLISSEKGKLIQNRYHLRDTSTKIDELKKQVLTHFQMSETATAYVEEILKRYPRYRRDQLLILLKIAEENPTHLESALNKSVAEQLYSANDFRDVIDYLVKEELDVSVEIQKDSSKIIPKIAITTQSMVTYTTILGGPVNE